MSQYNWYSLEKMLYEKKNNGRSERNKSNVYFRDFINHYKSVPQDFTSNMILDMSIAIVARINKILTHELPHQYNYAALNPSILNSHDFEREYYKELTAIAYKNFKYDGDSYSKPTHRSFPVKFEKEIDKYSSKGKSGYVSEFKLLLEDLSLFKESSWYSDLSSEFLFRHVDIEKVPLSIGAKNFILSLDKVFPFLKDDSLYIEIKEKFFKQYYSKVMSEGKSLFSFYPLTEILSFLKDSYNENVLKKVIGLSEGVVAYSYLKNKAAVDKLISLYPESKELLSSYMNEIKEDNIGEIFREINHKVISIVISFITVQKILLLDKVKTSAYDIRENFLKILSDEKGTQNNPLSWYLSDDVIVPASKGLVTSILFKVPNNEYEKIGEDLIKEFIKNQFLTFVNEYPKKPELGNYDILWQEFLIKKQLDELPVVESKSPVVKKF